MLVEFQPTRLTEVGSGYFTKFARRAIRKHGLATHITSIDPEPRAEIDQICDRAVRRPLEEVDLTLFDELQSGDFLFIESSHRTFTNSDVTIVFMELLPLLRQGAVILTRDIFGRMTIPSIGMTVFIRNNICWPLICLGQTFGRKDPDAKRLHRPRS